MKRFSLTVRAISFLSLPFFFSLSTPAAGLRPDSKAAKYYSVLLQRPTGDYLFDRFVDAWTETGSVDSLSVFLKRKCSGENTETVHHLLYGIFLLKQNRENEAVAVFENAARRDPRNIEALSHLAKALARSFDFDRAVQSADRALNSSPNEKQTIELGKLKGSWLSRSGNSEQALAAWQALLKEFPRGEELREDIVDLQLDENLLTEAIATQQGLISLTRDPYQKIIRRLRLGDIYVRMDQLTEAEKIYSDCLHDAGHDTWLEKDVLSRIDQLFRKEDNIAGLKVFYKALCGAEPGRVTLLKRRAVILAELEEKEEAVALFRQILSATPGDRKNREEFVDLLEQLGQKKEAAAQMVILSRLYPGDLELLAKLARSQHRAGKTDQARETVNRWVEASGPSAGVGLRAVRMFEQFNDVKSAEELLDRIIAAQPENISVREERAAFLYRIGKKDAAFAEWKKLAREGGTRDAIRSAEMLSSRGRRELAYEILKDRVSEFENDFGFLGQFCEHALATDHATEAVSTAEKRILLAKGSAELTEAIRQTLAIYRKSGQIDAKRAHFRSRSDSLTVNEACLLSEIYETAGAFQEAEDVIKPWLQEKNLLALNQRVRQLASRYEWSAAADALLNIIQLPQGKRTKAVEQLVSFYERAMKFEDALKWITQWKRLSPGSATPWLRQAAILRQSNPGEAIEILRKTCHRFEDNILVFETLASYCRANGEPKEAERVYWRLYEASDSLADKLKWAGQLAVTAQEGGELDSIIERFENRRRTNRSSVAPLLALAEIYRQDRNSEKQIEMLRKATQLRSEDLALHHAIARVQERENDWESAVETLRKALPLDKTDGTKHRIASLHLHHGDEEIGYRILEELHGGHEMKADDVVDLASAMISRFTMSRALEFLDKHRHRFPGDYRIAYCYAIVLEESDRRDEAQKLYFNLMEQREERPGGGLSRIPTSTSVSGYASFFGALPSEAVHLMELGRYDQLAYPYLQAAQGRGIQAMASTAALVPQTLEEVHKYSLAHLRRLAAGQTAETINETISRLKKLGYQEAEVFVKIPFLVAASNRMRRVSSIEGWAAQFPNSEAALAIYVANHVLTGQTGGTGFFFDKAGTVFEKSYPHLSLLGRIGAAQRGGATYLDKLEKAIGKWKASENPPSPMVYQALGRLLLTPQRSNISSDLREEMINLMGRWTNSNQMQQPFFGGGAGDLYAMILRGREDLTAFAAYLDKQCAAYEIEMKKSGRRSAAPFPQFRRYFTMMRDQQDLFEPIDFPPDQLPNFAPNVLWQFLSDINQLFVDPAPQSLNSAKAAAAAGKVKDPYLAAMFYHAAGNHKNVDEKIEEIAALSKKEKRTITVREGLFIASWLQDNERWEEAGKLLERIRVLPMDRDIRESIEIALVVSAVESGIGDKEAQAADRKNLALWGPAAALRLRYSRKAPSYSREISRALRDFGYSDEADHLEERHPPQTRGRYPFFISRSTAAQPGTIEKVLELLKDKKTERARKELKTALRGLARSYRDSGTPAWQTAGNHSIDALRRNHRSLLTETIESMRPFEKNTSAIKWIEFAALMEILLDYDKTVEAYDKAFATISGSLEAKHLPRYALLKGLVDKETGSRLLLKLSQRTFMGLEQQIDSVKSLFRTRYSRDTYHENLSYLFIQFANAAPPEKLAGLQLGFINDHIRKGFSRGDIAAFYHSETRQWIDGQSLNEKARAAHQKFSRAMIRVPSLAAEGFGGYACLANEDEDLSDLAREALQSAAGHQKVIPSGGQPNYGMNHSDSIGPFRTLWRPEEYLIYHACRKGESKDSLEPVFDWVKKTHNRHAIRSAQAYASMLYDRPERFRSAFRRYCENPYGVAPNEKRFHHIASRARKLYLAWEFRKEELPEFDEFLIEQLKRHRVRQRHESALFAIHYLAAKTREYGWEEEGLRTLTKWTELWLGRPEGWEAAGKEIQSKSALLQLRQTPIPGQYGSFPLEQYFIFLVRCGWELDLAFPVMQFLAGHKLDSGGQITEETLLGQFRAEDAKPGLVEDILERAPFLNDVEAFRIPWTLPDRSSVFSELIEGFANWPAEERGNIVESIRSRGTFGSEFALLCIESQLNPKASPSNMVSLLEKHQDSIGKWSDQAKRELSRVLDEQYPDGFSLPNLSSSMGRLLSDLTVVNKKRYSSELRDQFLKAASLNEIEIRSSSELYEKLDLFGSQLLREEKWGELEQLYLQAVALVEREQASGGFAKYRSSWNARGQILDRLAAGKDGVSSLEQIAFFHRAATAQSTRDTIAVEGGGERIAPVLVKAFNERPSKMKFRWALTHTFLRLRGLAGGKNNPEFGMLCRDLITALPPAEAKEAINWAEESSRDEGYPWAPMAGELSNAWKLKLSIESPEWLDDEARAELPQLDSFEDHYQRVLVDESVGLPWRVAIAGSLARIPQERRKEESVYQGANLLAEVLLKDAPFHDTHFVSIVKAFQNLPKRGARWETVAERLRQGWAHKNRNNSLGLSTGKAWLPESDVIEAAQFLQSAKEKE